MELEALEIQSDTPALRDRALRVLPVVGVAVLALLVARPGMIRINEWWDTSSAENYYYEHGYSAEALLWLSIAIVAIWLALAGFSRTNIRITLAGAVLAGLALLAQPLVFDRDAPLQNGHAQMNETLNTLHAEIGKVSSEIGHLPFSKAEMSKLEIADDATPIVHSGTRHRFRLIVAGQRDEVFQSPPIGAEPGDIYYTISSDERSYVLSVVGIDGNVSNRLIIDQQLSKASPPR